MKIIKRARLQEFWTQHRRAKSSLEDWYVKTKAAKWKTLQDARRTFGSADPVKVASGRTTTVFNIGGNNYRLITAIHYNTKKVYVLRFMTHTEYNSNNQAWKNQL